MILLCTFHTPNLKPVSDITWEKNKLLYVNTHKYYYYAKTDNWYGLLYGYEKIQLLIDILNSCPKDTWIWWTGTDTLITNHTIKVEDKIEEALLNDVEKEVIMSGDFNWMLVPDSILIKNSENTKIWLNDIMSNMYFYGNDRNLEMGYMLDSYEKYKDLIKLMPQFFMNSYDPKYYGNLENGKSKASEDVFGNRGIWEVGDWLIHFAGIDWKIRYDLVKEYDDKVIY